MNGNRQSHVAWSTWPPAVFEQRDAAAATFPAAGVALDGPEELLVRLRSFVTEYEGRGRDLLNRNPLESLVALVAGGAAVYYAAERGRNDKVNTYWDALEYVATCASVGYSNIFPNTPLGKIVASLLFLVGPNLSARALDPPQPPQEPAVGAAPAELAGDANVVAKLDELLAELRKLNSR